MTQATIHNRPAHAHRPPPPPLPQTHNEKSPITKPKEKYTVPSTAQPTLTHAHTEMSPVTKLWQDPTRWKAAFTIHRLDAESNENSWESLPCDPLLCTRNRQERKHTHTQYADIHGTQVAKQ
jgi:hypothetical protein